MKNWIQVNKELEKNRFQQQFKELIDLLKDKEKDVLEELESITENNLSKLNQLKDEIEKMIEDTRNKIIEIEDTKNIDNPKEFLQKWNDYNSILESKWKISNDTLKTNQFIMLDYSNELNLHSAKSLIESLPTSFNKLNLVRWKIFNLSSLHKVKREYSSIFKLCGFHWYV